MERTIIQYIRASLPLLTATALLSGCVKRELEMRPAPPQEGTVEIAFTWPEGQERPVGAHLRFYTEDGVLYREHSDLTDGYTGTLPAGSYLLILHNTDAEQVDYAAMERHSTAEVYALASSGLKPTAPGESLREPHKVYGIGRHDQGENFTVTAGQTLQMTVAAERLTREVQFYFKVSGLNAVQAIGGTLRGVSPSVSLCTGECRPVSFVQPFDGTPYVPQNTQVRTKAGSELHHFSTMLEVFDLLTRKESPAGTNTIYVEVTSGEGTLYPLRIDITQTLQELIENNQGTLPIEIALEVELQINPVTAEISAKVTPWDQSGTGGGEFE